MNDNGLLFEIPNGNVVETVKEADQREIICLWNKKMS